MLRRLNLGCGTDIRPGYLNVDLHGAHKPDVVGDAADLYWLPEGHFQELLALDLLEHIPRLRIVTTLKHWNRVLAPKAVLRLQVPDVLGLLTLLQRSREVKTQETLLQNLFGSQAYTGDFHYFGFTDILLRDYLQQAGFRIKRLEVRDEWLFQVKALKIHEAPPDPVLSLNPASFIRTVYRRCLHREPDPEGLRHYLEILKSGIAREAVIEALKASPEYKP